MHVLICAAILLFSNLAFAQGQFEIYPDSGLENRWPDHITAEQNFYHCERSVEELKAYSAAQVKLVHGLDAKVNECLANSVVDKTCLPIQRGELYKPESESHGTPALLLAGFLHGQSLSIEDHVGNKVGTVQRTSCCNNGGRAHWFLREHCDTLPSPVYLRLEGGTCRYVDTPCDRVGN